MPKKIILGLGIVMILGAVACAAGKDPTAHRFVFSVDIGSDSELSDPTPDGNEGFDPGDAYRSDTGAGSVVVSSGMGTDGTARDDADLVGVDNQPNAEDSPVAVPVGKCPPPRAPTCYSDYFDLDGYDVVSLQISVMRGEGLSPPFYKEDIDATFEDWGWTNCIEEVDYLAVSFDDDVALGWASPGLVRVPVEGGSSMDSTYGGSARMDEIVGIDMVKSEAPPYQLYRVFGVAGEAQVHPDLSPGPDLSEGKDDDVDALDMLYLDAPCDVFLYSADHEARKGAGAAPLLPGAIYQEGIATPVIPPDRLGLSTQADIDAFELVWLDTDAGLALGVIFSVDEDDSRTPLADESDGLDPAAIYASLLDGSNYVLMSAYLSQQMYGITNSDELWAIDQATGAGKKIGSVGYKICEAMASDRDGRLFAATTADGGLLIEVDVEDPAASVAVATLGFSPHAIAFSPGGTLYMVEKASAYTTNALYTLDMRTYAVTSLATLSTRTIDGMAFDPSGRLWAVNSGLDELLELDPATGSMLHTYSVSYPLVHTSDDFCMAIDGWGRMYVANEYLLEIVGHDTGSPGAVTIGPIGSDNFRALAFIGQRFDDVDAIAASADDLYSKELDPPMIYPQE